MIQTIVASLINTLVVMNTMCVGAILTTMDLFVVNLIMMIDYDTLTNQNYDTL
jgi:hypothetical protein